MNKKHKMQNLMGGKERYIKPSIKTHKLMCESMLDAALGSGTKVKDYGDGDDWGED